MAGREIMRVGVPILASKLVKMLDAIEPSEQATIRYYSQNLIIEESDVDEAAAAARGPLVGRESGGGADATG